MKNTSVILNVVLFIGLGLLYFFHFSSTCNTSTASFDTNNTTKSVNELHVAYVNVDSILINYGFAQELNNSLTTKQTNMKSRLEKEMREFEKEAQVFQDKVQKGIYLTQQRAEEAQQKLVMRQQELQQLEMEYSNQLGYEQQAMNAQLFDTISTYISTYNTPEKYHVILAQSVASNILYGSVKLDITNEILEGLNEKYENNK